MDHVTNEVQEQELILEARPGRVRQTFIPECSIDQIKLYLEQRKSRNAVFCLPQNLE